MSPNPPVIQIRNLQMTYSTLQAIRGIDLEILKGEIFGLIGADGAGKSSVFKILSGVMEPTGGSAIVLGKAPRDVRLQIGFLTQQFSLYRDLSLVENIQYAAGLRQVPRKLYLERRDRYLKLMNLDKFPNRLAGELSGGMKQKLALCCALVSQPQILLLDEPTTGVDPVSRREFWDILTTLSAEAVTIVVATPYLNEAERCHRVAFMHEGRIQEVGTPEELKERLDLKRLEVRTDRLDDAEALLLADSEHPNSVIQDVQTFGDRLDVMVTDLTAGEERIPALLSPAGIETHSVHPAEITLENVFMTRLKQAGSSPPFVSFPEQAPPSAQTESIAIQAKNLNRTFGTFHAVKNLQLEVHYGEIYGLLGANGAGKTTTIRMLCGLLSPSSGSVMLAGQSQELRSSELRQRIGYMSQKFTLYNELTILQNLQFYAGVYGVPPHLRKPRIDWVLEICNLTGKEDLLTQDLPGGWKQRVAFGATVLHEPDILFLDEPTSGVDPLARRQFWKLLESFTHRGTAVLISTHYLEEAEHCNRLGFMAAGAMVAQGSPTELKASQPGRLFELLVSEPQKADILLKTRTEPWRVSLFGSRLHLVLDDPDRELPQTSATLTENGITVRSVQEIPFSLEDAFIGIISRTGATNHEESNAA